MINKIIECLYLGDYYDSLNINELEKLNITHSINLSQITNNNLI